MDRPWIRFGGDDAPDGYPWWWPIRFGGPEHMYGLRKHGDHGSRTDEEIFQEEEIGPDYEHHPQDFVTLWDHTGDAYDDYEHLANAFLKVLEENAKMRDLINPLVLRMLDKEMEDVPG